MNTNTYNPTTTDLAEFGYREMVELRNMLDSWINDGLPDDFENDGVHLMFNRESGNVFLTNSDYQVAMMNGKKLESWYFTPYEGREGFYDDLMEEYEDMHSEDKDYMDGITLSTTGRNIKKTA